MMPAILAVLLARVMPLALFAMNKVQIGALILAIVVVVIIIARRRSKHR